MSSQSQKEQLDTKVHFVFFIVSLLVPIFLCVEAQKVLFFQLTVSVFPFPIFLSFTFIPLLLKLVFPRDAQDPMSFPSSLLLSRFLPFFPFIYNYVFFFFLLVNVKQYFWKIILYYFVYTGSASEVSRNPNLRPRSNKFFGFQKNNNFNIQLVHSPHL